MTTRPTGTVTFLFTDIEGSTQLWEHYHAWMDGAHHRHEAILRAAIAAHDGWAYKQIGDAFQAAFQTAPQALAAAVAAQEALAAENWDAAIPEHSKLALRVRMALHTGTTEERADDYLGPLLNRVARLMSAGHGGQILLTAVTYELLRDALPPGVELRDLGERRLKDLIRPERVWQVLGAGLPADFPPLRTLDSRPNNLPRQGTALIGREREVGDVLALLRRAGVGLLTLTGPGGTGKTRLALQGAADLLDDFPDGVWFVELAPLTDHKLVNSTIAQVLGVTEAAGQSLLAALGQHLHEKHLLLLLDNFEQVADAAPHVGALLAGAPGVKVLVTSRVKLNVYGEHEYAVAPLALPDVRPGQLPPLERLTQYAAVRLFIERGQAARADFAVTNENAPAVAEICVRLDGLPLAIELAAARVKMLSPQALLARLSSRLKLLTGGARNLSARQQTLRGAIDWSYDLLSAADQQLLRRMAVFQGGRSLPALDAVCNGDGRLPGDVFDGVQSLLDKSLLQQREGRDGEPRFRLLETIHEYAREKLEASGEAAGLEREHAHYFMRVAEGAEPQLTGQQQQEWLDRLDEDYDNLRAALGWAGEEAAAGDAGAGEVGLRTAGAMWRFWFVRGLFTEGRAHLERALVGSAEADMSDPAEAGRQGRSLSTFSPGSSRSRAKALNGAGNLAYRQADYSAAHSLSEAAVVLGRQIGDKQSTAASLNNLGSVAVDQGDYASGYALFEESLALRRELGDQWGIARCLNNLGTLAYEQRDYAAARGLLEESLILSRALEDKRGIALALGNLGIVALCQEDNVAARALFEESLTLVRELGDKQGVSVALSSLGLVAYAQGQAPAARALWKESLALRRELGDKKGTAECLAGLGGVAVDEGQVARGAQLLGAVEALLQSTGGVLNNEDRLPYEQSVQQARTLLGEEAFARAWQAGWAMSLEAAVAYAFEDTKAD